MPFRNPALPSALLFAVLAAFPVPAMSAADGAADAGARFAGALESGDASRLGTLLPDEGKVRVRLRRMGPEEGSFSGRQVRSLFGDFFRECSISSARVERVDQESGAYALARLRVGGLDRDGRPLDLRLHLGFQLEGKRWTLREIRETPP